MAWSSGVIELVRNEPGYFLWPMVNSLALTFVMVFLLYAVVIEHRSFSVVTEYAPPLVNGEPLPAGRVPVELSENGPFNVTRYYERHAACPTDAHLWIECEDGSFYTFPRKAGTSEKPRKMPRRTFDQTLQAYSAPLNTVCKLHVAAHSVCMLRPHVDEMIPIPFIIRPAFMTDDGKPDLYNGRNP